MPLDTTERDTGPSPCHSAIWLHGLGADGHDFVPIVPELVRRDWPSLRFVSASRRRDADMAAKA